MAPDSSPKPSSVGHRPDWRKLYLTYGSVSNPLARVIPSRRLRIIVQIVVVLLIVVAILRGHSTDLKPFPSRPVLTNSVSNPKIVEEETRPPKIIAEPNGAKEDVVVPGRRPHDAVMIETTMAGVADGEDGNRISFGEQHEHGVKKDKDKSPVAPGKEEGKTGGLAPVNKPGGDAPAQEVRPKKSKSKNTPAIKHILNLFYDMGTYLQSLNEIINSEPNDGKWGFFALMEIDHRRKRLRGVMQTLPHTLKRAPNFRDETESVVKTFAEVKESVFNLLDNIMFHKPAFGHNDLVKTIYQDINDYRELVNEMCNAVKNKADTSQTASIKELQQEFTKKFEGAVDYFRTGNE